MKIAIASDHGGFELKTQLVEYYAKKGINLIDLGTNCTDSCDYPDIADVMCNFILDKKADAGILICGTGVGISIAANRHKGIRAAILYDEFVAKMAKEHNDANIAVLGGRTMDFETAVKYLDIFFAARFEGRRHLRRIEKMDR